MKISLLSLLLCLLCLSIMSPAVAVKVKSIYQADVPVASQSPEDRIKAEEPALAEVLVKISGNSQVVEAPHVKASLENADKMVQEFSYIPSPSTPTTPYILHVVFDTDSVNRLLRNQKMPTWGQDRPLILAWVEYEVPAKPAVIVSGDTEDEIQEILKKQANQRGLPLLMPVMDVTDMNQVSVNDIVTMTLPTLQTASKRYANNVLLVVRIFKVAAGFTIQSKMVIGSDQWSWNFSGKDIDTVVKDMMNNIANTLSGRYASVISDTVQSKITVKVTGISEQDDLTQVMEYVENLAPVDAVEPINISSSEVLLGVSLRGSAESFTQAVSSEQKLIPETNSTNDDVLVYQWNP